MMEYILDILFNIFIYPIEFLMQNVLDAMFYITNNYGLSIILLSIIVNLIILPLYYLAEKLKNDNQEILNKIQAQLDFFKTNFKGQEQHFYLQAFYKIKNYHPINNIKASLGLLLQIPFFIAAFHFIGNYEVFNKVSFSIIGDLSKADGLLFGINILPFVMSAINLLSVYIYSKNMNKSEKYQLLAMTFIFLVFLYFESSALLLYWSMNNLFSLFKNFIENRFNLDVFKTKTIYLLTAPFYLIKQNKILNFIAKDIYIQAIVLFFGIIFIYKAIPMAASDIGMYSVSYPKVAISLIVFFIISVSVFYFIYYFLPHKAKYFFSNIFTLLAISSLLYAFIIPYNIPILQALEMPDFYVPDFYTKHKIMVKIMSYSFFIFLFFTFNKIKNTLLIILLFSNIVLMGNSVIAGFNPKIIDSLAVKKEDNINYKKLGNKLDNAYSFSKESNVIVIIMDMFQGNILFDILKKYPKIKKELQGFTYYPNTLSYGASTFISMPALVGGKDFVIQNYILYKNKPLSLHELSYLSNIKMIKEYNYSYTSYNPKYIKCELFKKYKDTICLNQNEVILSTDLKKDIENIEKIQGSQYAEFLQTVSIFYKISFVMSMPHRLKLYISRKIDDFKGFYYYFYQINSYSQLENMNKFANIESKKKTFKLIHNELTHNIWAVDNKCKVVRRNIKGYDGFFNSSYCSVKLLISFFNKLKTLGIYDKTKIIIVSDHGARNIKSKTFANAKNNHASALLLVKDFNKNHNLLVSNKFLSNIDISGITLSGVSNNTKKHLDMIKNYKERELFFIQKTSHYFHNILQAFKIKNNIFQDKNWQKLNDKQIENLYKTQTK